MVRRHGGWGQSGESLVELIVAVAILGIGVVALLGGLATSVFTSAVHRDQADVSVVMTAAAERIKEADYKGCAIMSDYLAPGVLPSAYTVASAGPDKITVARAGSTAVFTVRFAIEDWYGDEFEPRPSDADCQLFDKTGPRMQLVTITALTADGKVSQEIAVVKRFNDCRPPLPRPGCDTAP